MPNTIEKPAYSWWSHSKSKLMPFLNYYQLEGENGIKYRVDYNFVRKLIRLSIENPQNGENYYAIIKNGNIIRERNANTDLSLDLNSIFFPHRKIFSTLPNSYLLQYIGGVYGIDKKRKKQNYSGYTYKPVKREKWTAKKFWTGGKNLGIKLKNKFWPKKEEKLTTRILRRIKGDLTDYIIASAITFVLLWYSKDYCLSGKTLGFFGLFSGGIDWLYRKRNPLLIKIFSLILPAAYLYLYGYLYQ